VDLSENQIEEIEAGAFDGLINLRVLNLDDIKLEVLHMNVFESAANKLCSPINLRFLSLNSSSIKSVQWSPETMKLAGANMRNENIKKKPDVNAAPKLFAKCGFRNKLEIRIGCYDISEKPEWCFLNELELSYMICL
jgi:hypothetical protein